MRYIGVLKYLMFMLLPVSLGAQSNYINSTGNVGIGTTSPPALLTVGSGGNFQVNTAGSLLLSNVNSNENIGANGIRITTSDGSGRGSGVQMANDATGTSSVWQFFAKGGSTDFVIGRSYMRDNMILGGNQASVYFPGPNYGAYLASGNYTLQASAGTDATYVPIIAKGAAGQSANLQEWQSSNGTALAVINKDGFIGIGTPTPKEMLSVKGTIVAQKVRVTLSASAWADYVFNPSYHLPALKEVEQYINQYKHLPEVPSAEEVEKEGLDLGNNQATLLKKIEELTLYTIEQHKSQQALTKKLESLELELDQLKAYKRK